MSLLRIRIVPHTRSAGVTENLPGTPGLVSIALVCRDVDAKDLGGGMMKLYKEDSLILIM